MGPLKGIKEYILKFIPAEMNSKDFTEMQRFCLSSLWTFTSSGIFQFRPVYLLMMSLRTPKDIYLENMGHLSLLAALTHARQTSSSRGIIITTRRNWPIRSITWRDTTHFDSEDDYRTGCRNVNHGGQQQSFSGLRSPGRSSLLLIHFIENAY